MKSITNDLKYWFTVHTSLDVIEEKIRKTDFKELYLGLLYLTEEFRMYNLKLLYLSNEKIIQQIFNYL
jgi:trafficking protein particle complex subunit 2